MGTQKIASVLDLSEEMPNLTKKFPHLELDKYFPAVIKGIDPDTGEGFEMIGLFTVNEVKRAMYRGLRNEKDSEYTRLKAMGRTERFLKGK